jgi:DNA-binding FadR family transcriptional regulator
VVATIDFHQAVARASKNPLSILIMDVIGEILIEEFKKFNFRLSDHRSIIQFHREILECIKNRDSDKIGDIMSRHILDVKKRLKI